MTPEAERIHWLRHRIEAIRLALEHDPKREDVREALLVKLDEAERALSLVPTAPTRL